MFSTSMKTGNLRHIPNIVDQNYCLFPKNVQS